MDAGNHHGAIEAYKRAIDCYPKTARYHLNEAYNNLGTAYFESGDPMKAKAAWEQALVLMPSDKTVRRNLIEFIYGNAQLSGAQRAVSPFVEKFFDRVARKPSTNGRFFSKVSCLRYATESAKTRFGPQRMH